VALKGWRKPPLKPFLRETKLMERPNIDYVDVSGWSHEKLEKEIYFAKWALIEGDDLTEGWLKHLESETARRGSVTS
jgi:hypothetical protein